MRTPAVRRVALMYASLCGDSDGGSSSSGTRHDATDRARGGTRSSAGCVAGDAVHHADGGDDVNTAHALDTGTNSEDSSDVSVRICQLAALLPAPLLYRTLTLCNLVHD